MTSDRRPIVNAAATLTRLGGSLMPTPVIEAMADAATRYVDLPREYEIVGAELAALTGNDDAAVTAGAAAALSLVVASAITGPSPHDLEIFPIIPNSLPNTVVMLRPQRNAYDYAVRMLGVMIVDAEPTEQSLRESLDDRTACVLWFAGTQYPAPGLSLEQIVAVAKERDIPVIVDAAAQLPPASSLSDYTVGAGAAAAIFSGGKGLRGPQTTGLVVGSRDLMRGVRAHAAPNHGIGRGMKVGKEELAGLLAAVRHALAADEAQTLLAFETIVAGWITGLSPLLAAGAPVADVRRTFPSEAGQPHGRVEIETTPEGPTGEHLAAALWAGTPRVAVLVTGERAIALNPQPLAAGDEHLVLDAVWRCLAPDYR